MQPTLIIAFERLNENAFHAKAELIDTSLSSAAVTAAFPPPWPTKVPSPAQIHTAFLAYDTVYLASKGGDRLKISARTAARKTLTTLFKKAAPYLELIADGDLTLLGLTGYDLRHDATHSRHDTPLAGPEGFTIARGKKSGTLVGKCRKLAGAGSYVLQICTGDPTVEANWTDAVISKLCTRIEATGLTPGKTYYVRLCGVGTNGRGVWTNPISLMVV